MKSIYPYALLGALFAVGAVNAATTTTTPVGYETLSVGAGFNYLGLRLHPGAVLTGTFETVTANSLTDTGVDLAGLLADNTSYIIEINGTSGAFTQVLGSAAVGSTITVGDNLTALGVTNGASYTIRPAASLSSVFGASNSAGLTGGFFGIAGADVVFVANSTGGFDQYYYDDGQSSWASADGTAVTGASIPLVYTDSLIISAGASKSLTITGEVKKTNTNIALSSGFNYVSSLYPAGATLASQFSGSLASIDKGFFGIAGADVFFVANASGGFNQYYYDEGQSSWADNAGNVVDATTISLQSGVIISNEGAAVNLKASAPASYSSL